jgi:23S rRNA pseudouridine1911/1915/1917 synthase
VSIRLNFVVEPEEVGERLDVFLHQRLQEEDLEDLVASRSKISNWIGSEHVLVNDSLPRKAGVRLELGARVFLTIPEPKTLELQPRSDVSFGIIFEDDSLMVIDKPAGLVVHPAAGNYDKTLVHGLLAHAGESIQQVGDSLRPGIVHRLDKDTSGLMVIAKTDRAYQFLVKQFQPPRTIKREYLAVTSHSPGKRGETSGEIDQPIGRHPTQRKLMAVTDSGRAARTFWSIERELSNGLLLRLRLETGRTHQIRVHLQHSHAPIVGDPVYGTKSGSLPQNLRPAIKRLGRQALHAADLAFIHPDTEQQVQFTSELPEDIRELIAVLE